MREDKGVDWRTCSEDECIGSRLGAGDKCLAHMKKKDLDAELEQIGAGGTVDARGVTVSAELLDRVLAAAPRDEHQPVRPYFSMVQFERATFGDRANFGGARFGDGARFGGARFGDGAYFAGVVFGVAAWFGGARFGAGASFGSALFGDAAGFGGARFGDGAWFGGAVFGNGARFGGARFGAQASFSAATIGNEAKFDGATFGDRADFANATFGDKAWFGSATFGDRASFTNATFGDRASFHGATLRDRARFGPLLGCGRTTLYQATFGRGSELAISTDQLDCRGMGLPDGGDINLRWAEVQLDGANVGQRSILTGVGSFPGLDEAPLKSRVTQPGRTDRPRVLSLRGCDVSNLVLSNVDLRACRFAGAHNLDQLGLEATSLYADRPAGWRTGRAVPPLWRWTRRRTLAEEQRWRRTRPKHAGWYPRASRARDLVGQERLSPADIALLYRALRKGREDSKDEPGAADFYYGEMEMRRHDRTAPLVEQALLWLYWLTAGYALRATRALGCLLGLLAVATVLLANVGFQRAPAATPLTATITGTPPQQQVQFRAAPPPAMTAERRLPDRLGAAALLVVEGAVFRSADQGLTYKGRLIHTTVRFLGPVLLALALLSIRGRVKR